MIQHRQKTINMIFRITIMLFYSGVVRKKQCVWINTCWGRFRASGGQLFVERVILPYAFKYKKDFFRNTMWEIMDEPAPIETILQFIGRYGMLPRPLLVRIYFYEAKKKRRPYKSIERTMTRHIAVLLRRKNFQKRRQISLSVADVARLWPGLNFGLSVRAGNISAVVLEKKKDF